MSLLDKIKNKAQQVKGQGKEMIGRRTGNTRLEGEGRRDRAAGGVKQAGEHAKDTGQDVRRGFDR
jgi:uncharacterized protein YjbJ (UPF0337 family)